MSLRAELYCRDVRAEATQASQTTVAGRLQSLVARGVLDGVRRRTWPDRVADTDAGASAALAAARQFAAWADSRGVSLAPAFGAHHRHSEYTGADYDETVLPVLCLALFEDGSLVGVYPHTRDGRVVSVSEAIAALESETLPGDATTAGTPATTGRTQTGSNR